MSWSVNQLCSSSTQELQLQFRAKTLFASAVDLILIKGTSVFLFWKHNHNHIERPWSIMKQFSNCCTDAQGFRFRLSLLRLRAAVEDPRLVRWTQVTDSSKHLHVRPGNKILIGLRTTRIRVIMANSLTNSQICTNPLVDRHCPVRSFWITHLLPTVSMFVIFHHWCLLKFRTWTTRIMPQREKLVNPASKGLVSDWMN